MALRLPGAWSHGRFQADEASVFLAYAWHHPWLNALFRPFAGYWNLAANAGTLITAQLARAGVVPLEGAPYVTMSIGLAAQMLPAVLILTGKAPWLSNRIAVIAALLIIATAPATEEVFFNTIHIQFHLALCVALILAFDVPPRRGARIGYGVILFLAPLCGPGAILILPLFALRALIERDFRRLIQLGALATGSALQLLLFYGSSPARAHVIDAAALAAAMFVRLIALPFLGIDLTNLVANGIHGSEVGGGLIWRLAAIAPIALFFGLIVVAAQRRDGAVWLALSAISIAGVTFGFGMVIVNPVDVFNVAQGQRYNFLPLVLLGLALVALWTRSGARGRPLWALLCALVLLNGAIAYLKPAHQFAEGPSWPAEVRAWRSNHDRHLAVWPRPWAADLSDHSHPCLPTSGDLARPVNPSYCESGWIEGFHRRQ